MRVCRCAGRCGNTIWFCSRDLLFLPAFRIYSPAPLLPSLWALGPHRAIGQVCKKGMKLALGKATSAIYSNPQIIFECPSPHITIGKSCRM